jgi:hypothetical protein
LLFFYYSDDVRTSQEAWTTTVCYGDSLIFLYVDDVRTSQEAHLFTNTTCYRDKFAVFYYSDDVRTSQEAWTTTVCFGDSFTFTLYL